YVLVASANEQTASLKLSLQGNAQTGFFEVATAESVAFLKSADDVITFKSGDEFEFTGYYKKQTDVKTSTIAENTTIECEFGIEKPEIFENGAIKAGFSISETKKVYFSQGNLQYQASTKTWRFAENQFDVIGTGNNNISSTYNGWIDLFGWGTSGWDSGAKSYQPYSCAANNQYYYPGGGSSPESLTGAFANADWGVYNAILNGGNQAGQWRTLTRSECEYLIKTRTNASSKKGMASVNGVNGLILLPDDWTLPEGIVFSSGVAEDNGIEYYATVNNYSLSEWSKMEANGAIFLPTTGQRDVTDARNFSLFANYWLSTAATLNFPYSLCFQSDICVVTKTGPSYFHGSAVRLVQDVE
ncbi:MAG: hypothetical protein J6X43_08700, partial [Bacteroidales bacterium]|nr:hypothetical protein [Bacteroidales bacterium]